MMLQAKTKKSNPLQKDGALVLGAEQDCYGGCTEEGQSFFGLMDEVPALSGEGRERGEGGVVEKEGGGSLCAHAHIGVCVCVCVHKRERV